VGNFGQNFINKFQIKKTLASDTKLCRIVVIDYKKSNSFKRKTETYCKTKGGSWK